MSAYKQFITKHFERTNTFVTQFFKEIDSLPEVGDLFEGKRVTAISEEPMDCEQPTDDHHNYKLYKLMLKIEAEDEFVEERVCVRKEDEL